MTTLNMDVAHWSVDGADFTFGSSKDGTWDIYQMKADGTGVERMTNNATVDRYPVWEP
jgi:Tol biopolymer transport system component